MADIMPRNVNFAIPDDPEASTYRYIIVAAKRATANEPRLKVA